MTDQADNKEQLLLEQVRHIRRRVDRVAGNLNVDDLNDLKDLLSGLETMIVSVKPRPSEVLRTKREAIRRIVESHRVCNPRVFGSVIHGDDIEGSDLDILVDPMPGTILFDICSVQHELHQLLGLPVDVLTPKALPERFRDAVLAEAVPV